MIRALAFTAALLAAAPAFAQTETAPPAPAAEAPPTPEEAAFEARSDAFSARLQTMGQEMQDAVTAAGSDTAKRTTDLDAIEARYQPEVTAFVTDLQAFVESQAATLPPEVAAQARASVAAALPQIQGITHSIRSQIEAAAVAAATAPAAQ